MIDTAKVTDYRELRFESIGDIRRELEGIERAHRAGTLRATGNWTPGQNFAHLAAFVNYAYDGYPPELANPPWIIRTILKLMKKKFLYKRMPRGVKIPKIPSGTTGADDVSFEVGIARLRAGLDRLEKAPPTAPNVIFGPMTHEEWRSMHQRHCESHLGFLHPK